jgi:cytochrome c
MKAMPVLCGRPQGLGLARAWRVALPAAAIAFLCACSDDDVENRRKAVGPSPSIDAVMRVADARRGERLFRQCAACHTIGRGSPDLGGPNLHDVVGRPIAGGSERFGYTAALSAKGGRWTPTLLSEWLRNPQRLVPGTTMIFAGVPDPLDRGDIIAYLKTQSEDARKE